MKLADLPRYRRLLALCGISAALHLLLLDLIARRHPEAAAAPADMAAPLSLRLVAPSPARAAESAPVAPAAPAAPASAPARKADARTASQGQPSGPSTASATAAPLPPAAAATAPPPVPASAAAIAPPADEPAPLRLHLRARPPKGARLIYTLVSGAGPQPQTAFLDWRPSGSSYALDMDGVLGRLSSRGVIGDDGIQPSRAVAYQGERELATGFDRDRGRVLLADGSEASADPDLQDAASLLVRLASIGAGSAGQLQDGAALTVADAGGVHAEDFQMVGEEEIDTGIGRIKALHLAQRSPPGQARLDAWLAPESDWLPVQLRLTRADGASATQVLLRVEGAAGP